MKKKCLIIAMDFTNSAAGIIFKRLIQSMQNHLNCDLFCPCVDDRDNICKIIRCKSYRKLPNRINALFFNGAEHLLIDKFWAIINKYIASRCILRNKYDAIISFVYGGNYAPIFLGNHLKTETGLPWIVYSVDAIPTPLQWIDNRRNFDKELKALESYLFVADAFFSANPKMLQYQKRALHDFRGEYGVVLTPSDGSKNQTQFSSQNKSFVFLYAGHLYGPRKIHSLVDAFYNYWISNQNAKLIFVGNCNDEYFKNYNHLLDIRAIEKYPFLENIDCFYQQADVLIDLNADIENDVFLSSKVCNYLSYDKPILAISQDGSPVREIMSGYGSIIHCHHDSQEILEAMDKAASYARNYVDDRSELREKFDASTVAKSFSNRIVRIIDNNSDKLSYVR